MSDTLHISFAIRKSSTNNWRPRLIGITEGLFSMYGKGISRRTPSSIIVGGHCSARIIPLCKVVTQFLVSLLFCKEVHPKSKVVQSK